MKTLVTYFTQSGNTKKVAEVIGGALDGGAEIKPLAEVAGLEGYDLAFVGFPIIRFGPPEPVVRFLAEQAAGRRIALFATHAAPESQPEVAAWLAPAESAARAGELVGLFHCQGELAAPVKAFMLGSADPNLRAWAQMDDSQGQPDAGRLAAAADFARQTVARLAR